MLAILIGTSLVLTWPIVQWLIFPSLFRYFNRPSEETPVRDIETALFEIYGI